MTAANASQDGLSPRQLIDDADALLAMLGDSGPLAERAALRGHRFAEAADGLKALAATTDQPAIQFPLFVASLFAGRRADAATALATVITQLPDGPSRDRYRALHTLLFAGLAPLDHLVCPRCHGALDRQRDVFGLIAGMRCAPCDLDIPVAHGRVPLFVSEEAGSSALMKWSASGGDVKPGLVERVKRRLPPKVRQAAHDRVADLTWRAVLRVLERRAAGWSLDDAHPDFLRIVDKYHAPDQEPGFLFTRLLQSWQWWNRELPAPSLEIGGGYGRYTNTMFAGRRRITYSSEYFGHTMLPRGGLHPDSYAVYDALFTSEADALPLPTGGLNTVLAMHVLHHVPRIEAALAEVARVLRPGGRFHATVETCNAWVALADVRAAARVPWLGRRYTRWRLTRPNKEIKTSYISTAAYAQGMTRFTLPEWHAVARRAGLELTEVTPYAAADLTSTMRDLRYQGYWCPPHLLERVNRALVVVCWREISEGLPFDAAHTAFLTFTRP